MSDCRHGGRDVLEKPDGRDHMTNLEYMYANDKRALMDFVGCNSDCDDCRARPYCDEFVALGGAITEAEWLMSERAIIGSTENGTDGTEGDEGPA